MPQQEGHLAFKVLGKKILRIHLLDLILPVRIELGRRAAGHPHDLAHRPAMQLNDTPADV
jgi:hypothetical protein